MALASEEHNFQSKFWATLITAHKLVLQWSSVTGSGVHFLNNGQNFATRGMINANLLSQTLKEII